MERIRPSMQPTTVCDVRPAESASGEPSHASLDFLAGLMGEAAKPDTSPKGRAKVVEVFATLEDTHELNAKFVNDDGNRRLGS
jgi:hypothetical protein